MPDPRRYEYRRFDVFTDRPFGGNPLAVFLKAEGLQTEDMQTIAREMNLSESVFVTRAEDSPSAWTVRFFTPGIELPFAGHPTVGTAVALFLEGLTVGGAHAADVTLIEGVGPVKTRVRRAESGAVSATFDVPKLPQFGPEDISPADLAELLGLERQDLMDDAWRPRSVSCGVPFYFVAVRSLEAIKRVRLRRDIWERVLKHHWAPHLYVVTPEPELAGSQVHARMFPPAMAVDEDPATGGAAAALSGFLIGAQRPLDGVVRWRIEQGFEIGRPSLIDLEADVAGHTAAAVRLGGEAVPMGAGFLSFP